MAKFEIDPFRKHCLINGLDDIGLTMEKKTAIDTYETKAKAERSLGLIARLRPESSPSGMARSMR